MENKRYYHMSGYRDFSMDEDGEMLPSDYDGLNQFMANNEPTEKPYVECYSVAGSFPMGTLTEDEYCGRIKNKWLAIWWSDWTEWKIIQPITDLESLKEVCEKFFFDPENMIADEWVKLEWVEKDGKWFGGYNDGWLSEETEEHIKNRELVFELQRVNIE